MSTVAEKPRIVQKIIYPDGAVGYAYYELETKTITITYDEEKPTWDLSRSDTWQIPFLGVATHMDEEFTVSEATAREYRKLAARGGASENGSKGSGSG